MMCLLWNSNYDNVSALIIVDVTTFIYKSISMPLFSVQNCFQHSFMSYFTIFDDKEDNYEHLKLLYNFTYDLNYKTQYLSVVKYVVYLKKSCCSISHTHTYTNMFLIFGKRKLHIKIAYIIK